MKIILYKFNKKNNSTARPSNSTQKLELDNVEIKTPSSINQPLIQLAKGTDIIGYNYLYIPSFNRYYFINDITYNIGIWLVSCVVDVLASFREDILASSQYILRSASSYNNDIIDMGYTTKASNINTIKNLVSNTVTEDYGVESYTISNYFDYSLPNSCYVIGVLGDGVRYYHLTYFKFARLMRALNSYIPNDFGDVVDGIAKATFDPMSYIVSCRWYPYLPVRPNDVAVDSITLGSYTIDVSEGQGTCYSMGTSTFRFNTSVTIPKHPQANNYSYLQLEPFSRYNLFFEPFGNIPLDTTQLYGKDTLNITWNLDVKGNSDSELFIYSNNMLVTNAYTHYGLDIPVTQTTVDYIGAGASFVSGVGSAIGSLAMGNVGGFVAGELSAIAGTVSAMLPQKSMGGSIGSGVSFMIGQPELYLQYALQVDTDITRYGRPLCEVRTLNTLSGYVLCSNAVVNYSNHLPISSESEEVNMLLNNGVYIE